MSLTSLRSAAGFANNALDTARSTWKAMADAAVTAGEAAPAAEAAPAEVAETSTKPKGIRLGSVLDAYA